MKGYKDYMNSITIDPILYEKIMNQQKLKKSNRPVFHYVGMAACVAVLLIGILFIHGIFNVPPVTPPDITGKLPQLPNNGGQNPAATHDQNRKNDEQRDPVQPIQIHTLVLNRPDSSMSVRRIIPDGYFSYSLTDEQLAAVFPNLSLNFMSYVMYRDDGAVWYVSAGEYVQAGNRRQSTGAQIYLGTEGSPLGSTFLIYEFTPVVSDVHDVSVTAFVFGLDDEYFQASFVLDDIEYLVQTMDSWDEDNNRIRDGEQRLTEIVNKLIVNGAADLTVLADPIIPELRNERLTLAEARLDPNFGAFLPQNIPEGLNFESASRVLNPSQNSLFASWHSEHHSFNSIRWFVRTPTEDDLLNLVSVQDRYKFDVSLYPIPWALSVPKEIHYYFQSPVFLWEEMSLDIVKARTRWAENDIGHTSNWQTSEFNILYGDVLVQVSANGLSPEEIWAMLPIQ